MKINSSKIAKLANVSRATVSRVINNNTNVKEETRERVLKIIKEFNYTPNTNAQTLAGKANDVIGVFIFDDRSECRDTEKKYFEYFSKFIIKITQEAFYNKKQVLVDIVATEEDKLRLKSFFANRNIYAGVIIGAKKNDFFIRSMIEEDLPLTLIDYSNEEELITDNIKLINTNDYKGGYEVTEKLIKNGHKKILHVTGNLKKISAIERKRGYVEAMLDNGLEVDGNLIINGEFYEQAAFEAMEKLIKSKVEFTGIFSGNDVMAYGILEALKNYKTKEEIENIEMWGFDNLRTTIFHGVKTVDPRLEELAVETIKNLTDEEKKKKREISHIDVELIDSVEKYLDYVK